MVDVAIVGGGIGGLSAAIALGRRGFDPIVYEQIETLGPTGAGIWMPPNAMAVFERLDLAERVRDRGVELHELGVWTSPGRPLQRVDLRSIGDGRGIVSIRRSDLHRTLAAALPAESIRLGKRCVDVTAADDGVTARFADGTVVDADVLIGADGLRSTVRRRLFPDVSLRYSGQTCFLGLASTTLPDGLRRAVREFWGRGRRFGVSAVDEGEVYWFAPHNAPRGGKTPKTERGERLSKLYEGFPDPVPAILDAIDEDRTLRLDLFDFGPIDRWWRGRAVLLGDAAHATTPNLGQGGAQAVEDAYVLAAALAEREDPRAAFRTYQRTRLSKARRVVRHSRWIGRAAHLERPVLCRVRNALLRALPPAVARREFERLYRLNF